MLKQSLPLENLIIRISSRFLHLDTALLDAHIGEALEQLGQYLGADLAALYLFPNPKQDAIRKLNAWYREDGLYDTVSEHISIAAFPWWMERMKRLEVIYVPDTAQMEPEARAEKEVFAVYGVKAHLSLPVGCKGEAMGFLTLNFAVETLLQNEVNWLQLLAEAIGAALQRKADEEELSRQHHLMRHLIDYLPNVVYIKDGRGNFLLVNRATCELLNTSMEKLLSTNENQMGFSPEELKSYQENDRRVIFQGQSVLAEEQYTDPLTGATKFFTALKKPFVTINGEPSLIGISTDITQFKENELKINRRLEVERMLAAVSARLVQVNTTDQLQECLRWALGELGSFLKADHALVALMEEQPMQVRIKAEYCTGAASPLLPGAASVNLIMLDWWQQQLQGQQPVVFDDIMLIPSRLERIICQGINFKSLLSIPVAFEQWAGGYTVFGTVDQAKVWQEDEIRMAKLVTELMITTIRRIESELQLQRRLRIEHIISEVSSRLISTDEDNDQQVILYAMQEAGQFLKADYVWYDYFTEDLKYSHNSYSWSADGVLPCGSEPADVSSFDWWMEQLHKQEVFICHTNDAPAPEQERRRESGIQTTVEIPVFRDKKLLGYIAFASLREKTWQEDEVFLIKTIGEFISYTLKKRLAEQEILKQKEYLRQILDTLPNLITVRNQEGQIIMANQPFAEVAGKRSPEVLLAGAYVFPDQTLAEKNQFFENIRRVISSHAAFNREESTVSLSTGQLHHFMTTYRPLLMPDGNVYALVVNVDMTARRQAEEQLRSSEAMLQNIYTNSSDALFLIDPVQHHVIDCNKTALELFGFSSKEQALGTIGHHLHRQEPSAREIKHRTEQLEKNGQWEGEVEYRRFDTGESFWGLLALRRIDLHDGLITLVRVTDITERKRAGQLFQAVFDNATDALFLVGLHTNIIEDCNEMAMAMFGFGSKDEVIGKNGNSFHKEPFGEAKVNYMFEHFRREGRWEEEVLYVRQDNGQEFWGNLAFSRLRLVHRSLMLVRITNISERKHKEEELRQAMEKAESSNRLKSQFLANMSHEIRTPLNGVLGLAQVIRDDTADAATREYALLILDSGKQLLNTINNILDFSKMEAGKADVFLKVHDVNEIVQGTVRALKVLADEKKLYLQFDSQGVLQGIVDEVLLQQILINLIGNAIKFTESGGVSVSTELEDNTVVIRIRDTGIGIAEKYLPYLFTPFTQASTGHGRRFGGTGLGLSIARGFIEAMGGRIEVYSREGEGSIFEIYLAAFKGAELPGN